MLRVVIYYGERCPYAGKPLPLRRSGVPVPEEAPTMIEENCTAPRAVSSEPAAHAGGSRGTEARPGGGTRLGDSVALTRGKILNPALLNHGGSVDGGPVLVLLAAGKGTRFGREPKCIQLLHGKPLARYSIDAFRGLAGGAQGPGRPGRVNVVCIVGYRYAEVSAALGADNVYVRSANPTGGTAFAVFEAFSVPDLEAHNPPLVICMGDRAVPSSTFRRLLETHGEGDGEADLTLLTAEYVPPAHRGKGRILRDAAGKVQRIVEERDIFNHPPGPHQDALLAMTEGNCPLYMIRARTLLRYLGNLSNANAQGQYYLTDIVEAIVRDGGEIRTVTTRPSEPEYELLCSDVTQPKDITRLKQMLTTITDLSTPEEQEAESLAEAIAADRPAGQVSAVASQLEELAHMVQHERLSVDPNRPVGIGISGGRLRLAFMHPDMVRFYGPAWQMPIGAADGDGDEQIVVLAQPSNDGRIRLYPMDRIYRENRDDIDVDMHCMYPGTAITDAHAYEAFGTKLSREVLLSLGYFDEEELTRRRDAELPLPPSSRWVETSMRRPFPLVTNVLGSLRTLMYSGGSHQNATRMHLGRGSFTGMCALITGRIPCGGFSSSSAVTVGTLNALNSLYNLNIEPGELVRLACQSEYGTGVRAGSLDQATEQLGRAHAGTLISSNPREHYRTIGTYPMPSDRIQVLFPYTVDRDREAWRWSWGAYAETPGDGPLTAAETRKMTGKAAECAAILCRLPLTTDFFTEIQSDLVGRGRLSRERASWVTSTLRQMPLRIGKDELREKVLANRDWYVEQLMEVQGLDDDEAARTADATIDAIFSGWREPRMRCLSDNGSIRWESGVPLRAMLAYLFGEVAKNFHLIRHPEDWIETVTRSQWGDRCVEIDCETLPERAEMEKTLSWEKGAEGPALLARWLNRCGAVPFDFNQGLSDADLDAPEPPDFRNLRGSNFFRGLALIDLAEAMLKRAFGADAVAVRVNAAGQGDFFQVHVDKSKVEPDDVKQFLRAAFYQRFGFSPEPEFVEPHSGGGAVGLRLSRYSMLPNLIRRLRMRELKGKEGK